MTTESQRSEVQRSLGKLEAGLEAVHGELRDFRQRYEDRLAVLDKIEQRLGKLENREMMVNPRTWAIILAAASTIAAAVATVIAKMNSPHP